MNGWRSCLIFAGFALLVLGVRLLLIAHFGSLTPMHDEWDGFGYRLFRPYVEGHLGWNGLTAGFNEHRIIVTRLYTLALLRLDGGVWNPLLQMVGNAVLQAAAWGGLLWALWPTCPAAVRVALLMIGALLLVPPLAVENALVGFQSQFYFLLLFSLAGLWALATATAFSGRWWLGLSCCGLAVASMASGALALVVAALIQLWRDRDARSLAAALLLALLAGCSLWLIPSVHTFDAIRAHTPGDFLVAALRVFSWPLLPGCLLVIYLPLARFLWSSVRRPLASGDPAWVLLALGLWLPAQLLAIAYSRAGEPITSRYVDLFVLGLLLNGACLLRQEFAGKANVAGLEVSLLARLWLFMVLGGLIWYGSHLSQVLAQKLDFSPVAEANVRAYLQSHDYSILLRNKYPYIPYAEPDVLKRFLDDSALVSVLPPNLVPAHASLETGPVITLLAHLEDMAWVLLAMGLGMLAGGLYPRRANALPDSAG